MKLVIILLFAIVMIAILLQCIRSMLYSVSVDYFPGIKDLWHILTYDIVALFFKY